MHVNIPRFGTATHALLLVLAAASCTMEQRSERERSLESAAGDVRVALSATLNMTTYRLRDASFTLSGPQSVTLSSEQNVDAEFVSTRVIAGTYRIVLADGWRMERQTGDGYVAIDATLLSSAIQSVEVTPRATSLVRYRFRLNGAGEEEGILNVGIEVEDPSLDAGVGTDAGASVCTTCPASQICCRAQCADECSGGLRVRAFIDGRSQLLVRGNSVWWRHFDYAAPGLHVGYAEPTELWSYVPGASESHSVWCPSWPTPCNTCEGNCGELRGQIESLPFEMLDPPLPDSGRLARIDVEALESRGRVSLVQEPVEANDYTMILEFDDNALLGPAYYEVALDYTFTSGEATPADAAMDGGGTPGADAAPDAFDEWDSAFPDGPPDPVPDPVLAVSVGAGYACAVMRDHAARCWGTDWIGRLGYGNGFATFVFEGARNLDTGMPVREISAGMAQTCALLEDGSVRCWGSVDGRGHGDDAGETPANAPSMQIGAPALRIVSGASSSCALLATGSTRCWAPGAAPAETQELDLGGSATQVALSSDAHPDSSHACAVLEDGSVVCWGDGADYKLGYGNTARVDVPPGPVDLGGRAVQVAMGWRHTCALLDSGRVRCWGYGGDGQLGYPTRDTVGDDETPASAGDVDVGGLATQITAGVFHTCVLLESGRVRCFGAQASPSLPRRAIQIDAGFDTTCAVLDNGELRCWCSSGLC